MTTHRRTFKRLNRRLAVSLAATAVVGCVATTALAQTTKKFGTYTVVRGKHSQAQIYGKVALGSVQVTTSVKMRDIRNGQATHGDVHHSNFYDSGFDDSGPSWAPINSTRFADLPDNASYATKQSFTTNWQSTSENATSVRSSPGICANRAGVPDICLRGTIDQTP